MALSAEEVSVLWRSSFRARAALVLAMLLNSAASQTLVCGEVLRPF